MTTSEQNIKPQDVPTRDEQPGVRVKMPDELIQALKERAADEDRSLSAVVRVAVRAYLADAA